MWIQNLKHDNFSCWNFLIMNKTKLCSCSLLCLQLLKYYLLILQQTRRKSSVLWCIKLLVPVFKIIHALKNIDFIIWTLIYGRNILFIINEKRVKKEQNLYVLGNTSADTNTRQKCKINLDCTQRIRMPPVVNCRK